MRKVLIADDSELNRAILRKMLKEEYEVLEASDGKMALELIRKNYASLSAILLDLVMPSADGFEVLRLTSETVVYARIPVIVCAGSNDAETRERAYSLGAVAFLQKPYHRSVVLDSLRNLIRICEMAELKNTVMNDQLTGLLTGEVFFEKVEELISKSQPNTYVLECMDIDNFKVINNLYGIEEGNCVLRQVARAISEMTEHINGLCGHIFADNFVILYPNNPDADEYVTMCRDNLCDTANLHGNISISAGRYVISDVRMSVNAMYDYASIAKHSVKGKYDKHLAYFDQSMLRSMLQNQLITCDMKRALSEHQFEVWFQPQINHATGSMIGAEALVRWRHPRNGLISPGTFIPVFEQNGFIYELDKYIWERVCMLLRKWINEGKSPLPVSVNLSRIEILSEDLPEVLCGLLERYDLPASLLRLEITESAFARSTEKLVETVKTLKAQGFTIEIDDFGSGYSSLNTLKAVPADVIKLDMRFLEESGNSKRGGNIIESVVRMVKWLGMAVLAEGVETKEQADFLKTVGCCYVQGYLYAKPMPVADYEKFVAQNEKSDLTLALNTVQNLDNNAFWDPKSMETLIFNSYVGGASIIEYHNGKIEPIRANDLFNQEFNGAHRNGILLADINPDDCMDDENRKLMYRNLETAIQTRKEATCEVVVSGLDEDPGVCYLRSTVRVIAWTNDRYLLYCVIHNITNQRMAEQKRQGMYAELLDHLPCGVGLYEYDGKSMMTLHLNREYWTLVDRKPSEAPDPDSLDAVHPDDRPIVLPEITDALLQKRSAVFDIRIRHGESGYRKFHVIARIRMLNKEKYLVYAFYLPVSADSRLLEEKNRSRREKEQLEFVLQNAAISVWSYNLKTGEIIQNARSCKMHGFESVVKNVPESLIKCGFIHPDSVSDYLTMYQKLRNGEKEAEGVFRVQNADRTGYWYEHIRYAAVSGENQASELVFGISSDVSAQYEQDQVIRQWMTLISDMQAEKNAICEFDLTKNVFVRKQGNLFPPMEISSQTSFDTYMHTWVKQNVHTGDAEKLLEFLDRSKLLAMHERGVLDGGMDYRAVIRGETRWCSVSIKFLCYPSDEDVRVILMHTDIHTRKKDELRLIEENRRDPLTGVLNRKAFEHQVNQIIAAAPNATHALFMIDFDNFKNINDAFGHITGDHVLQKTADGLRLLLKDTDLVGRIGGDEFMIFLPNVPEQSVIGPCAQSILEMMHSVLNPEVQVSGSLGIAIAPKDGDNFERLYRAADKAAYFSKQHGKNRYTIFTDAMGLHGQMK